MTYSAIRAFLSTEVSVHAVGLIALSNAWRWTRSCWHAWKVLNDSKEQMPRSDPKFLMRIEPSSDFKHDFALVKLCWFHLKLESHGKYSYLAHKQSTRAALQRQEQGENRSSLDCTDQEDSQLDLQFLWEFPSVEMSRSDKGQTNGCIWGGLSGKRTFPKAHRQTSIACLLSTSVSISTGKTVTKCAFLKIDLGPS